MENGNLLHNQLILRQRRTVKKTTHWNVSSRRCMYTNQCVTLIDKTGNDEWNCVKEHCKDRDTEKCWNRILTTAALLKAIKSDTVNKFVKSLKLSMFETKEPWRSNQ